MFLFENVWLRYFVILIIALLPVLMFAVFVIERISENDSGVCIAEKRVLGAEEHRKAFLRSMIQREIDNDNIHERYSGNQSMKTGIIRNSSELDFRQLLVGFFDNGQSFEDNFAIDVIASKERAFDIDSLSEPFVIVTYDALRGGSSTFTDSQSVIRTEYPTSISRGSKPTLIGRYRGFGNYYYSVTYTFIGVECCDNKTHYRSQDEYLKRKIEAYFGSLDSMDKGSAFHTSTAAASNCGEILTEDSDNGMSTQSVRWVR